MVGKPIHESTPHEARALTSKIAELAGPAPEMVRVEECTVEGTDGETTLRILVPLERSRGVLVYYHGGGWVTGSADEYDTVARKARGTYILRGCSRGIPPCAGASLPGGGE